MVKYQETPVGIHGKVDRDADCHLDEQNFVRHYNFPILLLKKSGKEPGTNEPESDVDLNSEATKQKREEHTSLRDSHPDGTPHLVMEQEPPNYNEGCWNLVEALDCTCRDNEVLLPKGDEVVQTDNHMVHHVLTIYFCLDSGEEQHRESVDCQIAGSKDSGPGMAIANNLSAFSVVEVGATVGACKPDAICSKATGHHCVQDCIDLHSVFVHFFAFHLTKARVNDTYNKLQDAVLKDKVQASDERKLSCGWEIELRSDLVEGNWFWRKHLSFFFFINFLYPANLAF